MLLVLLLTLSDEPLLEKVIMDGVILEATPIMKKEPILITDKLPFYDEVGTESNHSVG